MAIVLLIQPQKEDSKKMSYPINIMSKWFEMLYMHVTHICLNQIQSTTKNRLISPNKENKILKIIDEQ